MKKITSLLIAVFAIFVMTACGEVKPPNGGGGTKKTVNLTYADWGDQELNQMMIDAFMEEYPHIKVTIEPVEGSGAAFTGNLVLQAQGDFLPDVFAIDNVPTVIKEGLTLDLAPYWDADEDAKLVYPGIAETGVYNGKRYAVPSFQFFKGIMLNKTIFKKKNLTTVPGKYRIDEEGLPYKDWTYDEMVELAKVITNYDIHDKENFVSGLGLWFGSADFQQVWPFQDDPNVGYDTWDGEKFNYTSESWINAMKVKVDLMNNVKYPGVTSNFPTAEEDQEFLASLGWMIATGYQAMAIDGTWNFPAITQGIENGQDIGFWPYPGGEGGQKVPTILDYQCVSSQTRHPEEAFLLAKWMTFGKQGWLARLKIFNERRQAQIAAGEPMTHLIQFPVANYPEVWDEVDKLLHDETGKAYIDGLQEILDNIENSQPDLDKWLAGYKDFWTWVHDVEDNPYRWVNLLEAGPDAVPTYAAEWERKINEIVAEQLEELGK